MKKLLICIGLFTASSHVDAAATAKKQLSLVWRLDADAMVQLPGEIGQRYVRRFPAEDLRFFPSPGINSPIFIEFLWAPKCDTEQAKLWSGTEQKIEIPEGVASWDALPDQTKIVVATYRARHDCEPLFEVTLGQSSLRISQSHSVERSIAGIQDSMASVAAAVTLVAQAPLAAHVASEIRAATLKDDGE